MSIDVRTNSTAEAYDSLLRGITVPNLRKAQSRGSVRLPPNSVIVSPDSHWSLNDDIFYKRFPAHLKDRAPRLFVTDDGNHIWLIEGKSSLPEGVKRTMATFESVPGCYALEPRLRDMDSEGIDKEINFPNGIAEFYAHPNLEEREWIFRIYNEHLAEMQAAAPGRFYGVGLIMYWNMEKIAESIHEVKKLGIKTIFLPQNPRGADGAMLNYCLPEMNPLWEAIEDAGLPVCFHVGEFFSEGPGGHGTSVMVNFGPFRKNLGELIFGGIFDRHPRLQVVFVEAEINWVPGALQTATMGYECYGHMFEPKIKHHPRHYWHNNCYATFSHDPIGLRMLDVVGTDRVMWASDYPHPESTLGYTWDAIRGVVDAPISENEVRDILGGNAMRVFKLND